MTPPSLLPPAVAEQAGGSSDTEGLRLHWGYWTALTILVVGFASIAIDSALHFDDTPIDGPFQLFNALRRLANGQRFGGSFQFFHGLGIPYLHVLPYHLFGGGFLASELSRQLVSTLAAIAILVATCRAWVGSWKAGIPLAIVALVALIPLRVNALIFPINSMLGLRSTMPLVVAIHLRLRGSGWRAVVERGALLGVTIACGIEQASATIVALIVVEVIRSIRCREISTLLRVAASVVLGLLFFLVFLFVVTPTGFASVLRFNFSSLPADQFWYFGGPPNRFLYRWRQLAIFVGTPVWSLLVVGMVGWCLARFWKRVQRSSTNELTAEAFLAVYALVSTASMLGTFNTVYFQPAVRVGMLLALFAIQREWLRRKDRLPLSDELRGRVPSYALLSVLGFTLAGWPLASISVIRTPLHLVYAHGILRVPPTMTSEWNRTATIGGSTVALERALLGRTPRIWSTYASYLEWKTGVFHPFFDYIIHALGHANRVAYAERFAADKPDIVQTIAPTYTMYEEWLETNHWNFYRPLLRDYSIVAVGPWSYFWVRRSAPWNERAQLIADTPIPPGTLAIAFDGRSVPTDSIGLFEVTLHYHAVNPWRAVPVIGSLPRYVVYIGNSANHYPLSLAPYETTRIFPVLTVGPGEVHVRGAVVALLGHASLVFDSIRVERIRIAPENMRWATDFTIGPPRVPVVTGGTPAPLELRVNPDAPIPPS